MHICRIVFLLIVNSLGLIFFCLFVCLFFFLFQLSENHSFLLKIISNGSCS